VIRTGATRVMRGIAAIAVLWGIAAATPPAGASELPDGRAYELVSPPAKNGVDVIPQTTKTHVASDGNGVTFSTIGGFGLSQGTTVDAEYLSKRTSTPGTNGWSTRGINPLGAAETFPMLVAAVVVPTYVDGFTRDLSAGIYVSWRSLTDAPNVAGFVNLYRISGLGSSTASAELLSDSVAPLPPYSGISPLFKHFFLKPDYVGASSDLRHVAFESALDLTSDAPPQPSFCVDFAFGCPTLLYENADGVVRLVGRVPEAPDTQCDDVAGPPCVAASSAQAGISPSVAFRFFPQRMISANGRAIAFQVPAGADSGAIYVREDGVRTVQLAQDGQIWDMSADGSRVFFSTGENLVGDDADGARDLYMYDANASGAHLTLVSAGAGGDLHAVFGASADGHYVYFDSDGLYLWHDGSLTLIGQIGDVNDVAVNSPRTPSFPDTATASRVSPDGRHLLFMTRNDAGFVGHGGFLGYDHADHRELYLYSAGADRLVCTSCNPTGAPATTDAATTVKEGAAIGAGTTKLSHALTDDGRRVFFTTAEALVPRDTNGVADAYEYDASTGTVHLISSGADPAGSFFIDASANGDDVFFATRERLVGWDVDDNYDLYDARIGGGFPEPVTPAPCSGDACLGQGTPAPAAGLVASPGFRGAGNAVRRLRRHRRCGRRAVLRRVRGKARCVKRRSHRRAHRARLRDEGSDR
jgi:hypothetical protein